MSSLTARRTTSTSSLTPARSSSKTTTRLQATKRLNSKLASASRTRLLEFNRAEETNSDVEDLEDIYQTATGMFDIVEPEGDFAQDPYNVTNAEGQMIEGRRTSRPVRK